MSLDLADAVPDDVILTEPPIRVEAIAPQKLEAEQMRDFAPARGIGAAIMLSVPFWLLFAFALHLMR